MKRFAVLLLALAMTVCCAMPAFAAGTIEVTEDVSVSDDYDWTRFKGQNVAINVYNWGEYISNGSDDSVDVVAAFEKLTGIKVNYTTFDSNESMYAKLKSGAANYDVVIPSDYMVAKMIAEGMLKPLNYDNIPNFKKIDQEYVDPDYDPQNAYTVPYMLCTTGIIYNTTMVDKAPTSWADLWDEQYAGNILMFNNSRDAYAIAAFKSGHDINPQSTEEVDEVVEELKAQKPLVQAYVMDEIFDKMIGGEAVNVVALPLLENASIDEYGEKAMQTFKQMPEGSIVLFDLASGTPFNQMMMKSGGEEFPGLCGMNLPVLLEAMTMREAMKGSELVALLEESAKAAVVNIKSFFEP